QCDGARPLGLPLPPPLSHGRGHVHERGGCMSCRTSCRLLIAASLLHSILPFAAQAQQQPAEPGWPQPVENDRSFGYALLNQNELRVGSSTSYRWEGEGWYGGDLDRLWVKSEGSVDTSDGTRE